MLTEALSLLGFNSPLIQNFNSSDSAEIAYRENATSVVHNIVGVDFRKYWSGSDLEQAEYVLRMPPLLIADTKDDKYTRGKGYESTASGQK